MQVPIYINARFLTQDLTGVQKFSYEITKHFSKTLRYKVILLTPRKSLIKSYYDYDFNIEKIGVNKGHLWEQIDLVLYLRTKNNPLLINLTNSAPILYNNQIYYNQI